MINTNIKVSNLTKKFGKFTALDSISLDVKEGEVFGYIGPNGAGKTTTIRVLLGILKASSGKAEVFGMDAWSKAVDIHKRLAFVPGDVNLWPNLTGGEVIDLFVNLRGTHDSKRREELVEKFELDPTKKCRTYSKGNRQKVALIAAFASDVDLYILDEPTSGLDPLMGSLFNECVIEQKNKGKTIFLSSHIMSEVEHLCDRVGIIKEGKIIEIGTLCEMRHLTRVKMDIVTSKPVDGLELIEGVHDIHKSQDGLSFQVDNNSVSEVVSYIAKYGVLKLHSAPPSLEELFMQYYTAEEVAASKNIEG